MLNRADGRIAFRFHARDVNLVMRSREGTRVPFSVLLDGNAPGAAAGVDVDSEGNGVLDGPRLYQLIREGGDIVDRTFESDSMPLGSRRTCSCSGNSGFQTGESRDQRT